MRHCSLLQIPGELVVNRIIYRLTRMSTSASASAAAAAAEANSDGASPPPITSRSPPPPTSRLASLASGPRPHRREGRHASVLDCIGNTPIVRLSDRFVRGGNGGVGGDGSSGANVYVKLESENPGGSLKDRLAYGIIEWAERHGQLQPGQTVVEASSGNTGIGLAMVCASKGYPLVCVMSEAFSVERRKLMRFFGAKVVLTNPAHKATGMMIKAKELADKHNYFWTNQFESEANAWIHEQTTGPEICRAFEGDKLDHFVTAYGTGGNLLGISRYLRVHSPATRIHVCEPSNAPMLYSGVETRYEANGDGEGPIPAEAHPVWRPHLLQGWAADFIPKLVRRARQEIPDLNVLPTSGNDAMETCRLLARNEGIFSGTSGGGIVHSALRLARTCPPGTNILALVPDTAERYLSTPLFADVPADMTPEEKALAASTPSRAPPPPGLPEKTAEAVAFVLDQVRSHKVVVWSLEYCEFCWTLTRFLDRLGVPYERIDIDSFQYAKGQMGNKYRAALVEETRCATFPQLFLNGKFLGGAVDAAMMWKKGELQPLLEEAGLNSNSFNGYSGDPFEYLPKWMTANPLGDK